MFIWGHALVHFLSPGDVSLQWSALFSLCLSVRPFGLMTRRFLLPLILLFPAQLSSYNWCSFIVLQDMLSKTLDFQKNIEASAPLLRVPLRWFVSGDFGGGSKVVRKVDEPFRVAYLAWSVLSYMWSSILSPGCCFSCTIFSWRSCWFIVPFFPVQKDLQNSSQYCFASVNNVPGSLLTDF